MNDNLISLIYDDSEIKILKRFKNGKFSFAKGQLSPGIVHQGLVLRPLAFLDTLSYLKKEAKPRIKSNNYIIGLPEKNVYIQIVEIPKVQEEKILEVIRWQADKLLSFSIENVYLDYRIIDDKNNKLKILVTAANKDIIDALIKTFALGKSNLTAIDSRSGALANIFLSTPHQLEIIVYIEGDSATLVIAKNNIARFSSIISFSQDIKKLAEKIDESIYYYTTRKEPKKQIHKIFICGSLSPKQQEIVKNNLRYNIDFGDEKEIFGPNAKPDLLNFFDNLGLLNGLGKGISLIPRLSNAEIVKKRFGSFTEKLITLASAAGIILLIGQICLMFYLGGNNTVTNKKLTRAKSQKINPELEELEKRVIALNQKATKMIELDKNKNIIMSKIETIVADIFDYSQVTSLKYDSQDKTLTVGGIANSRNYLQDIQSKLTQHQFVQSYTFPLQNLDNSANGLYEFSIVLK